MEPVLEHIKLAVQSAYGRGREPTYWFVQETVRSDPHRKLVDELERSFAVHDDTDTNDDVSFNYLLRKDGKLWRLALSMVGPFALLVGGKEPEDTRVITETGQDPDEAQILNAVRSRGFAFLDRDTIRKNLDLDYETDDDEEWTVYHALFVNSEMPPG